MSNHLTQCDSEKEVQEGNQLRTAIMDSVTHELRTPLTSIKASVTALLTNSRLQRSQRIDRLNQLVGEVVETVQLAAGVTST